MSLGLYMDEHVPSAITAGLRKRGVDVLTAQEDGRDGEDDDVLLSRATELGRVLFSQDRDLLREATARQRRGQFFAGVAYADQLGITIGKAIDALELLAVTSEVRDMANSIEYLPH